jgi:hypothetical protein
MSGIFDAEAQSVPAGSARWYALRTHEAYAARHGYAFIVESSASIAANVPQSARDMLDPRHQASVPHRESDADHPHTPVPPVIVDLAAVAGSGRITDAAAPIGAAEPPSFDYWPRVQPDVDALTAALKNRPANTGLTHELEGQLSWLKAAALIKWLPHFDYILWLDPDVLVMDFTLPIAGLWRSAAPGHPTPAFLFQVDQLLMDDVRRDGGGHPDSSAAAAAAVSAATGTTPPLQLAAFVVRSCRFARRFLADVAWPLRLLHGGRDAASMQRAAELFAPRRLSCRGNPAPNDVPLPLWEVLHCALDEAKVPRAGRYRRRFALLDEPHAAKQSDVWGDQAETVEATTTLAPAGARRMPLLDGRPLTRMATAAPQGAGYVAGAHGEDEQDHHVQESSFDGTFSLFFRRCITQGDACRAAAERAYLTSLGRNGIHHDAAAAANPVPLSLLNVPLQ